MIRARSSNEKLPPASRNLFTRMLVVMTVTAAFSSADAAHAGANGADANGANAKKRVAVLIGIDEYGSPQLNLNSPKQDVALFGDALDDSTDFVTLRHRNVTRPEMIRALLDARDQAAGGTVVFYFSGHAIQVDGENYLLPKGVQVRSMRDVPVEAVSVRQVLQVFHDVDMKILILDSCRTNPFGLGGKSLGAPGLSRENLSGFRGTLISYAAAPGTVAYDGDEGEPSPFTKALVHNLSRPGLNIVDLFIQTRGDLERITAGRDRGPQRSEEINSLTADHQLIFVEAGGSTSSSSTATVDSSNSKGAPERLALAAPPPKRATRRQLLIPGLRANEVVNQQTVDALNALILSEFQRQDQYVVVGGSDIAALLEQESEKQLAGCTDDSCLAEIGEALGADVLAKTSLGAVGGSYLLTINLIEVENATPLRRVTARSGRDDNFLIEAAQKAVQRILDDTGEEGVIIVGTGVSDPAVTASGATGAGPLAGDVDERMGPLPAWPFAALTGLSGLVALGSGVTSGVFFAVAVNTASVSPAAPNYEQARTNAQGQVDLSNIFGWVGVGSLAAGAAFAGATALFFVLGEEDMMEDVENAGEHAWKADVDVASLAPLGASPKFTPRPQD